MIAESEENNDRSFLAELRPGVRDAVQLVLNDRLPADLTRRALDAVRQRAMRYPRMARRRIAWWPAPAIAASVALIALAAYFGAAQTAASRAMKSPSLPSSGADVVAALDDGLPTAWAYSQAAKHSPEALAALMDRQSHRIGPGNPQVLAGTNASLFLPIQAFTIP